MYSLDRSSRKYECPRCGRKSFVIYVDEFRRPLHPSVGRCDRKDKCAYHRPPRDYFAERRSLGSPLPRSGAPSRTSRQPFSSGASATPGARGASPSRPDTIPFEKMMPTLDLGSQADNLRIFLHRIFDPLMGADDVELVLHRYYVGSSRLFGGAPIFWQVDHRGRIRTGKIMSYDPMTGKRTKGDAASFAWVHSRMRAAMPDFRLSQCYFGSVRMQEVMKRIEADNEIRAQMGIAPCPEPQIWLFESEKAALIVALVLKWGGLEKAFIPMATGGCDGFNPMSDRLHDAWNALSVLKGRRVVLFPDEGKYDEWSGKAEGLRGHTATLHVTSIMESSRHPDPLPDVINPGDALDDLLLRRIVAGLPPWPLLRY